MKIYAKTLPGNYFNYQNYIGDIENDIMIDGGRDFKSINYDSIESIKKMIDDYNTYDYKVYYNNSIMEYLKDMLPKKKNGKKLSPKEAHNIRKALESVRNYRMYKNYESNIIVKCLSIIMDVKYKQFSIRGYCQGDYAEVYAPENTSIEYLNYIEAIYFATGTEVMVNEECEEIESPKDIFGFKFYTASYNEKDIKQEVADQCRCNVEDVILYMFDGYSKIPKYVKY